MTENVKKKTKIVPIIILSILVLLLAGFVTAYFFMQTKLSLINRPDPVATVHPDDEWFETDHPDENDGGNYEEMDPDDIVWPEDDEIMKNKNVINIMLIGQDRRPGEERARSDSMMIATIDKEDKTIKITSLMRDMYVQIPGYSDNRINTAYAFGGMKLLDETIEKNFLVSIDGNIEVDFNGFKQVVDKIGGIDIPLNKNEAKHLKKQGFGDLTEGMVHMDGKLALAYARIRKVGNADYERTERQRRVMSAAFDKVKGLSYSEMISLVDLFFPLITTDLTNGQILNLAYNVFTMKVDEIETHRIPVNYSFDEAEIRGMQVLVPDLGKNRDALFDIIYGRKE